MADLQQILIGYEPIDLFLAQRSVTLGEQSEISQLIIVDIATIFLGKKVLIDPVPTAFCQNNTPMLILVQTLLENSTTKILRLSKQNFSKGLTQIGVGKACLAAERAKTAVLKARGNFPTASSSVIR